MTFLLPIERASRAANPAAPSVKIADSNLRGHQRTASTVLESQQNTADIVQYPARHDRPKIREYPVHVLITTFRTVPIIPSAMSARASRTMG